MAQAPAGSSRAAADAAPLQPELRASETSMRDASPVWQLQQQSLETSTASSTLSGQSFIAPVQCSILMSCRGSKLCWPFSCPLSSSLFAVRSSFFPVFVLQIRDQYHVCMSTIWCNCTKFCQKGHLVSDLAEQEPSAIEVHLVMGGSSEMY